MAEAGTPSYYRQRASEAREQARAATDAELARQLSEVAKLYDRLADYAERQQQKLG